MKVKIVEYKKEGELEFLNEADGNEMKGEDEIKEIKNLKACGTAVNRRKSKNNE